MNIVFKLYLSILFALSAICGQGQTIQVREHLHPVGEFTPPDNCPVCAAIDVNINDLNVSAFRSERIFGIDTLAERKFRLTVVPRQKQDVIFVETPKERYHLQISSATIKAKKLYTISLCGSKECMEQPKKEYNDNISLSKWQPKVTAKGIEDANTTKQIEKSISVFLSEINYAYNMRTKPIFHQSKVDSNALAFIQQLWKYNRFKSIRSDFVCVPKYMDNRRLYMIQGLDMQFVDSLEHSGKFQLTISIDSFGKVTDATVSLEEGANNKLLASCVSHKNIYKYLYMISYIEKIVGGIRYTKHITLPNNEDCKYFRRKTNLEAMKKNTFKKELDAMSEGNAGNFLAFPTDEENEIYFASCSITKKNKKIYIGMQWNFSNKMLPWIECMMLSDKPFSFYNGE